VIRWAIVSAVLTLQALWAAPAAAEPLRPEIFPQIGHTRPIVLLGMDARRAIAATYAADGALKVWDIPSRRLIRTIGPGRLRPVALAVSSDGGLIAAGGEDGSVVVWNDDTGEVAFRRDAQTQAISGLAFLQGSNRLVASTLDGIVRILGPAQGASERELRAAGGTVTAIAVSPNGDEIAAAAASAGDGGAKASITLWAARSGAPLHTLTLDGASPHALAFSGDGKYLASASGGDPRMSPAGASRVNLWNASTGALQRRLTETPDSVQSLSFSASGARLLVIAGGNASLWDGETGAELAHQDHVGSGAGDLLGDGPQFVVIGGEELAVDDFSRPLFFGTITASGFPLKTIRAFEGRDAFVSASGPFIHEWGPGGKLARRYETPNAHGFVAIDETADGALLAALQNDGIVIVWSRDTGKILRLIDTGLAHGAQIAFFGGSHAIAAIERGGAAGVWNADNGAAIAQPRPAALCAIASHPGRPAVLASDCAGAMFEIGTDLGRSAPLAPPEPSPIVALAGTAGGWIAYGRQDGVLAARAPDGRLLHAPPPAKPSTWTSVSIASDGGRIAASNAAGLVSLWSPTAGAAPTAVAGDDLHAVGVALIQNGGALVVASLDGAATIWDAGTLQERVSLYGVAEGGYVAVTPEGYFASNSARADQQLNVRIGHRVFGIDSYRDTFLRPDVVEKRFNGEPVELYSRLSDVPASPVVDSLAVERSDDAASWQIRYAIADGGGGLGEARVFLNDTAIAQAPAAGGGQGVVTIPAQKGGGDTIRVAFSNREQSMWSIVDAPAPPADSPPVARPAAPGVLYVLAIGVNDYPNLPDKDQLHGSVHDAEEISQTLIDSARSLYGGGQAIKLITLEDTTRSGILDGMRRVSAQVSMNDAFVFFVAAHGTAYLGKYYLAAANVTPYASDLANGALSQDLLMNFLSNVRTLRKMAILDTCDSGALALGNGALARTDGMSVEAVAQVQARQTGVTVLMAARAHDAANETANGHGLFTAVLLEGLGDPRRLPGGGHDITASRLAGYAMQRVPELARTLPKTQNRDQHPTAILTGVDFPLGRGEE
jgi:WD40 repeat protein